MYIAKEVLISFPFMLECTRMRSNDIRERIPSNKTRAGRERETERAARGKGAKEFQVVFQMSICARCAMLCELSSTTFKVDLREEQDVSDCERRERGSWTRRSDS